jgi:hypothetical protein
MKLKLSKTVLESTLKEWEDRLKAINAGICVILSPCPACYAVVEHAKQTRDYSETAEVVLTHELCKQFCPFHGRICCNKRVMHACTPLYYNARYAINSFNNCTTDQKLKAEATKYINQIIVAVKKQLEVKTVDTKSR